MDKSGDRPFWSYQQVERADLSGEILDEFADDAPSACPKWPSGSDVRNHVSDVAAERRNCRLLDSGRCHEGSIQADLDRNNRTTNQGRLRTRPSSLGLGKHLSRRNEWKLLSMRIPRVFGFTGWSGSGKTTLITQLIPLLTARGITVSTIKHAHHAFDIDKPGKDSYEHRKAGATEVLITSGHRWALMHELRDAADPDLPELLAKLAPVDLVLIEGFKRTTPIKIEVHRPSLGKPLIYPDDPAVAAVASDVPIRLSSCIPNLALDDINNIADFLLNYAVPITQIGPSCAE
jgi:molybdopterin-guanine dinucleotide biosynthesis adapter protein